ncbi:TPA: hypothetical protein O8U71_004824 [Escherichia coli]|nr:hypothetical protein [Escherichia coli]
MVEFPDFPGTVMGCSASLYRNSHFRLLYQPVKPLIARKFDLSCGFAMSIDTEKIKVRFSQNDAGDFLFRHGLLLLWLKFIHHDVIAGSREGRGRPSHRLPISHTV